MRSRDYNSVNWHEIFIEDSSSPTGLIWKVNRYRGTNLNYCFIKAGECAGYVCLHNERNLKYFNVKLQNKCWMVHRILWIMRNGYLENDLIVDHIDGNGLNNSVNNLRKVTNSINMRNQRIYRNNSTGKTGVCFTKIGRNTYAAAQWYDTKGIRKKSFNVLKLGLLPAFAAACIYRDKMIDELNKQGFEYSNRHGNIINKGTNK